MEVKSLGSTVTLDDLLFKIPADYRQVDPPAPEAPFAIPGQPRGGSIDSEGPPSPQSPT